MNRKNTIKSGFMESLPVAIAVSAYGISYGVLAGQANFNLVEAVAMSLLVFSGSVQMVAVAMLMTGASLLSVLFSSLLLNSRNLLYGAALADGLAPAKKWRWLLSFGVSDEPFVLGISRFKKYGPDPLYFGVVTATLYIAWVSSSFIGALIGNHIDSQQWGLDLIFPVFYTVLLIPGLSEKPVIATMLAAVAIAVGLECYMPGNGFTIIIAGIAAPLVGLYFKRRTQDV